MVVFELVSSRFRHPFFSGKPLISLESHRNLFAGKVVGRRARFGKRILLQQAGTVPGTVKERLLLPKIQEQIHQAIEQRGGVSSAKLERLFSVQRVLRESLKLRKAMGGRNPHVYHVLAKIALTFGLNSKEVKQASTTMNTLWQFYSNSVTWDGISSGIYKALKMRVGPEKKNLPSATEELLYKQKTPLTSKEIAEKLKLDFKKIMNALNCSMQLLETTMHANKLPLILQIEKGTPLSVWVHKAFKPGIDIYEFYLGAGTHYRNVQMEILNQLYINQDRYNLVQLYKEEQKPKYKFGKIYRYGNPNAIYFYNTILRNAKFLEEDKLIKFNLKVHKLKNREEIQSAELTPLGKKLWEKAIKTRALSEDLRVLLLGEKNPQIPSQNQDYL